MMKRCKLLVLLILICLLMLPVFATAETQEEFELRCFKKQQLQRLFIAILIPLKEK